MDKVSFEIFEPEEKTFRFTPDRVIGILLLVPLLMLWVFNVNYKLGGVFGTIVTIYFIGVFVAAFFLFMFSFTFYKPLKGKLNGEIQFERDRIVVNGTFFQMQDIRDLDFNLGDYFGKKEIRLYTSVNPRLSQGVDNYVTFIDIKNQNQQIYFKIADPQGQILIAPFINEAIKMKKMEFKRGVDLIGIENINI